MDVPREKVSLLGRQWTFAEFCQEPLSNIQEIYDNG